jgi:sterol desaturase/sphingolipid hydroxylase (fatty acid hydroxylase superfamily)
MEQFINDTLHIFGFELMSIQLFSISELPQALALFSFFLISDFIQWNVHRLLHTIPYGKSIKHTTVLKKWGLRRILDTTGWNLLFTNQYCIFLLSLLRCKPTRCIYCAFHLDCYWSLEPCQLRDWFLKYIFNNPKMHIWHHSKKMPNKYGVNFGISLVYGIIFLKPTTSLKMEET